MNNDKCEFYSTCTYKPNEASIHCAINLSKCCAIAVETRKQNTWIETYTRKKFNPFYPKEELIEIEDIYHALSMKVRFNGHGDSFYSVAHHSLCLAELCDQENKIYALLHDAAEAYLPDIPSPLKPFIHGFQEIEDNLLKCILRKFNLKEEIPCQVKYYDYQLCFEEAKVLGFNISEWTNIADKKELLICINLCGDYKIVREWYRTELLKQLHLIKIRDK